MFTLHVPKDKYFQRLLLSVLIDKLRIAQLADNLWMQ